MLWLIRGLHNNMAPNHHKNKLICGDLWAWFDTRRAHGASREGAQYWNIPGDLIAGLWEGTPSNDTQKTEARPNNLLQD